MFLRIGTYKRTNLDDPIKPPPTSQLALCQNNYAREGKLIHHIEQQPDDYTYIITYIWRSKEDWQNFMNEPLVQEARANFKNFLESYPGNSFSDTYEEI